MHSQRSRSSRRPAISLLALLALLLLTALSGQNAEGSDARAGASQPPAAPADDGLSPDAKELLRKQEPLSRVANKIRDVEKSLPMSGFAGVRVDAKAETLTLFWKGSVPKPVLTLVNQARLDGIHLVVNDKARFSRRELSDERFKILRDQNKTPGLTEATRVSLIDIPNDGSGLTLGVKSDLGIRVAAAKAQPMVKEIVKWQGNASLATRMIDTPPWYGGGIIRLLRPDGNVESCSTGFQCGMARMILCSPQDTVHTRASQFEMATNRVYSDWWQM